MAQRITVAAIQLRTELADSAANIARCERLALEAVGRDARWIALPEFFNTGVAWDVRLVKSIETQDGPAATFLRDFSARHGVVLGGSLLCRLPDGTVRNRYLCYAQGALVGHHDKDLPTMWENAFYEGGIASDTGFIGVHDGLRIGAAVCWEFMRTQTVRRLRQRVDLILGGSCWWSMPTNYSRWVHERAEPANRRNALACIEDTARLLGVPIVHAAHCGAFECAMPGLPARYHGHFEGNAAIVDASGRVVAHRGPAQGEGIVCAEITPEPHATHEPMPRRYWLRRRGVIPAVAWHYQRWLGRRWYARHVR